MQMNSKPTQPRKNISILIFGGLGLFIAGFALGGIAFYTWSPAAQSGHHDTRPVRQGGFSYINPLLECDIESEKESAPAEIIKLKTKVYQSIAYGVISDDIEHASVYFRDLNNGPWFGIDEKELFTPASLLKVPLMMAYLKKAESNPAVLSESFIYEDVAPEGPAATISPQNYLKNGKSYTVREMIEIMIMYSDNKAAYYLARKADPRILNKVYTDLGLQFPTQDFEDFMTVKEYASFFRVLFNASYLNREMSELALSILSRSLFKDGLVAKLPRGVEVSHKFGERTLDGVQQLHDCGIVYYPKRPYILCIMTRGKDQKRMEESVASISGIIFEGIKASLENN